MRASIRAAPLPASIMINRLPATIATHGPLRIASAIGEPTPHKATWSPSGNVLSGSPAKFASTVRFMMASAISAKRVSRRAANNRDYQQTKQELAYNVSPLDQFL